MTQSPLVPSDFVMEFFAFTQGYIRDTPDLFRRWSGIALVAAALERRVWAPIGGYVVFPNLYTFFVAPTGTGKGIIEDSKRLLEGVKDPGTKLGMFRLNPDNTTKASLMDELAKASITKIAPEGKGGPICYHALGVFIEDINGWMATYDAEIFGSLISLWGNRDDYKETRRTSNVKFLTIEKPTLNLLLGIQPEIMSAIFPEEAWHGGLTRRTIMVYGYESGPRRRLDEFHQPDPKKKLELQSRLAEMGQMYGECEWEPAALEKLIDWDFIGGPPRPNHSRLAAYNKNRSIFAEKLSIVSAVSRTAAKRIELIDVNRAIESLCDAELTMPDIFRAMAGKSDGAMMEELWRWVGRTFQQMPEGLPESLIFKWLRVRMPSDKIDRAFALAEAADYIRKKNMFDKLYIPGPKSPGDF